MSYLVSRTVIFFDPSPWADNVRLENEAGYINWIVSRAPKSLIAAAVRWAPMQFALRLLRRSRHYRGFAVGRYGYWFPLIYRGHKPIVLMDTEFTSAPGFLDQAACHRATVVTCNTHEEARRAAKYMHLPIEKFKVVLMPYQPADVFPATDGDYVFAGGSQGRDWDTFLKAVEGLPYPVRIYTSNKLGAVPSNVSVHWAIRREFYEAGAAAGCVVVPLRPERFRITGTTTWINSMGSGKPVIVTEPYGAPDYMKHGVSGFYCDYGDWRSIRQYIVLLMENKALRLSVGAAAKRESERFTPDAYRRQIISLLIAADTDSGAVRARGTAAGSL